MTPVPGADTSAPMSVGLNIAQTLAGMDAGTKGPPLKYPAPESLAPESPAVFELQASRVPKSANQVSCHELLRAMIRGWRGLGHHVNVAVADSAS